MEPSLLEKSWLEIRRAHLTGQFATALQYRNVLLEALTANYFGGNETILAQVACARLHLMMLEKDTALCCLKPFAYRVGKELHKNDSQISDLADSVNPFLAGLVLSQIANLLYRELDFDGGLHTAVQAEELLRSGAADPTERLFAQCENQIWRARLSWQVTRQAEVERALESNIARLLATYGTTESPTFGGIDVLLALTLELWAALDWKKGRLDTAKSKIYQALFLLSNGRSDDPVRRAYALYTAARIEASYSSAEFAWPVLLARQAESLFRQINHPFEARALIQRCQCLIKAQRFEEADTLLRNRDIEAVRDHNENTYVNYESMLTGLWLLEHEATEHPEKWAICAEEAQKLLADSKNLPRRLQAEANLHAGLAITHLPGMAQLDFGRSLLHEATRLAQLDGRIKIEIAGNLALSQSYLRSELRTAQTYWETALRLSTGVQSTYLEQWKQHIAAQFESPILLQMNQPFEKAEQEFFKTYISYHYARAAGDLQKLLGETGLTRSTYYRLRDSAGIAVRPKRGRPRKMVS